MIALGFVVGFSVFMGLAVFFTSLEQWHGLAFLRNIIYTPIIYSHCSYPETSKLDENQLKNVKTVIDVVAPFLGTPRSDIRLIARRESALECYDHIFETMVNRYQRFYLDQIDNLIITKMGMEVLRIKFPHRGKNRSLYLEVAKLQYQLFQTSLLFTLCGSFLASIYAWSP